MTQTEPAAQATADRTRNRILVVDDEPQNIKLLGEMLRAEGYEVAVARNGEEALARIEAARPNLVLLDVVMPGLSGYEVCERLRAAESTRLLPIILVTGARPEEERVRGLDAGADEFLTKPVNREELLARVRGLLRVEALHQEIAEWNATLEARVQTQLNELKRMNQLRNYLPEHVAELVVSDAGESLLAPRRRHVVVCAVDVRGFTGFSETAEPEETIAFLQEYYALVGHCVEQHGGAVESFAGDGMVIFFNAPVEIDAPEARAARAALAMQAAFRSLREKWLHEGHELGLGVGLAAGYATIGALGFSGRWQYAAIGTVTNLAARLCSEAKDGDVLATKKLILQIGEAAQHESLGEREIRGLHRPVPVCRIQAMAAD